MSKPIGSFERTLQRIAQWSDGPIPSDFVTVLLDDIRSDGKIDDSDKAALEKLLQPGNKFSAEDQARFKNVLSGVSTKADEALAALASRLNETGALTRSTLERAEAEVAELYGPEMAKEVLTHIVGARAGDLATDGLAWVQQGHGNMGGHLERFQAVLQSHIPGAQLIDANFDGQLDASDRYVLSQEDGSTTVETVGQFKLGTLKVQEAMVRATEEMVYEKRGPLHRFAVGADQQFNSAFWEPTEPDEPGSFKIKEGVKPSEALKDIFDNPNEYQFDCATAVLIVTYKAMLNLLGPKDFDRECAQLKIGPWVHEKTYGRNVQARGRAGSEATAEHLERFQPGDLAYIKNWDATEAAAALGWPGENIVVLPDGRYYGHPFGYATKEEIVKMLDTFRLPGSTKSASFTQRQERLMPSLLKLDKHPGE